jgi:hypothetical protein
MMLAIFKTISRLRQCHWLSWSTMFVVLTALVLIVVPGERSNARFGAGATPWEQRCTQLYLSTFESHANNYHSTSISSGVTVSVFEHGWPRPFLARALVDKEKPAGRPYRVRSTPLFQIESWFQAWGGSKYIPVSWSDYDHWPCSADGWIFDPWGLLFAMSIALVIVILVGATTQWWINGRTGRFSFHLRDLLGAIIVVGVLLGIYAHHTRIRRAEGLATTPLRPPGFYVRGHQMTAGQGYCGPVWLRKLAGSEYFPQLLHHINSATLQSNDTWRECYGELPKYPYLESVNIMVPLPIEALEQLQRCHSLKHLRMPLFSSDWNTPAPQPPAPTLGVEDLEMLGRLRLESIELSGDQILAQHVEQVARLPTITRISLRGTSAKTEEIEAIRRKHPTVTIVIEPDLASLLGTTTPMSLCEPSTGTLTESPHFAVRTNRPESFGTVGL